MRFDSHQIVSTEGSMYSSSNEDCEDLTISETQIRYEYICPACVETGGGTEGDMKVSICLNNL